MGNVHFLHLLSHVLSTSLETSPSEYVAKNGRAIVTSLLTGDLSLIETKNEKYVHPQSREMEMSFRTTHTYVKHGKQGTQMLQRLYSTIFVQVSVLAHHRIIVFHCIGTFDHIGLFTAVGTLPRLCTMSHHIGT